MKRLAARMPRWILLGMPLVLASTFFGHTGGGAIALLLWMLPGKSFPPPHYPYPRKSRPTCTRLFFAFSCGLLILKSCLFLLKSLPVHTALAYPGICVMAVFAAAFAWQTTLSRHSQILLSLLFCAYCL